MPSALTPVLLQSRKDIKIKSNLFSSYRLIKDNFSQGRGLWNSTALASLCSSLTNQLTTTIQELGTNQLVKQQTLCVDITV